MLVWAITAEKTSDASANYAVNLGASLGSVTKQRYRLIDFEEDFPKLDIEALDRAQYLPLLQKRIAKYGKLYHLDQLKTGTEKIELPGKAYTSRSYTPQSSDGAEPASVTEGLRLSVTPAGGKKTSWYFGFETSMCWDNFRWTVR